MGFLPRLKLSISERIKKLHKGSIDSEGDSILVLYLKHDQVIDVRFISGFLQVSYVSDYGIELKSFSDLKAKL